MFFSSSPRQLIRLSLTFTGLHVTWKWIVPSQTSSSFVLLISKIEKASWNSYPLSQDKWGRVQVYWYVKQSCKSLLGGHLGLYNPTLPGAHLSKEDLKVKVGLYGKDAISDPDLSFIMFLTPACKRESLHVAFKFLSQINKIVAWFSCASNPHVYISQPESWCKREKRAWPWSLSTKC